MSLGGDLWTDKMLSAGKIQSKVEEPLKMQEATRVRPVVANISVEPIENGYLVVYSKRGVWERRQFARDLNEVGEVTKAVCIELQLQGQ